MSFDWMIEQEVQHPFVLSLANAGCVGYIW